tara:strand:+ start:1354 stop:1785 length:432 start_codon:yes stop_codon:yes gene_type:complete
MGSIQQGEEEMINEKKSDYEDQIKAFLAKGGKVQKGDKPDQKKIDKVTKGFLKKYGVMKKKEADLDAKDKEELEKMMGEEIENEAREEAETMNKYMKVLEKERHVNLWAEAKRVNMFPPPVDGKKTMTGKPQNKAIINPKENE